jgi:hypothetical protein
MFSVKKRKEVSCSLSKKGREGGRQRRNEREREERKRKGGRQEGGREGKNKKERKRKERDKSIIPLAKKQEVRSLANVILTSFTRKDGMECERILLPFNSKFR